MYKLKHQPAVEDGEKSAKEVEDETEPHYGEMQMSLVPGNPEITKCK